MLMFTGKKIRNIDGPACLPGWKKTMVDQLTKAIDLVLRDEVTGLMLATTCKFPANENLTEGRTILCGTYSADLHLAARQAEWIAEKAHGLREQSPVRWV
ncbi:hypothetical protein J2W32_000972 [Variovorax boronicumulans]|uniref:Uncharacterized protein n=1 Tax=Variovorax boronicumulans TaxID=436515 RepID=A0AAW8CQA2_9BURK|nr:hypothetical protein [Variovorax boronicumulans]MDP9892584.1 hypothetical protein [Variovorax boronicumulans]MDQ0051936.1 hypothetical protein [Variovorax boronicumulans]